MLNKILGSEFYSVYEKFQAKRTKVVPVSLIYESHFSGRFRELFN